MNLKIMRKREVSKMKEYINTLKECLNEIESSNEKSDNIELLDKQNKIDGVNEVLELEKEVERKLKNLEEK